MDTFRGTVYADTREDAGLLDLRVPEGAREVNLGELRRAKSDDEKAVELVGTAVAALQKFYTDNGLSFAQVRRVKQEPSARLAEPATQGRQVDWSAEIAGRPGALS